MLLIVALIAHFPASCAQSIVDILTPNGDYYCFRVPGAVRSPSGALLVFAEARIPSCDDQAPKDVVITTSTDGGQSWSPVQRVFGNHGAGNSTFRNPTPVFTADGTLLLQFVNSTTYEWNTLQISSVDDGQTWSAPVSVGAQLGQWDGSLAGPGAGITLTTAASPAPGRSLYCGTVGFQGKPFVSQVWYSDTNGSAWNVSATLFNNMSECTMAELVNGSVLINFRANHENPCNCRAQARSDDGGATWTPTSWVPTLVEPVCSASLLRTAAGVFFSNPATTAIRTNMTVRHSIDNGNSWPLQDTTLVWAGPAAYSVLVPLSAAGSSATGAATVGLVFERGVRGPYEHISFAAVSVP